MVTKYIYIHKVPYTYIQFRKKCTVRVFSNIELKCNTSFKMIPGNLWLQLNIFFLLKLIIKLFLFFNVIFYVVLDFSNLHLFQRTGFHLCVAAACLTLPAVNAPVCRTKNSKRIIIQPRRIPQPLNCRNTTGYTIGSHYIWPGENRD